MDSFAEQSVSSPPLLGFLFPGWFIHKVRRSYYLFFNYLFFNYLYVLPEWTYLRR